MRNNTLLVVLVSALVAGAVGYSSARMANPAPVVAQHESVYDRVIKSGKLRCGYVIYPVSLVRDPNTGAFSGISYDIITQLGKELGLTIEWVEETSGGLMSEALKTDRFDLVCTSMWSSSARGKVIQFSVPVYYTAINAYARKDDERFKYTVTSFNSPDLTIATIDGSMSAAITRDDAPLAKTYALPDLTDFPQLFVAVKDKKADLTYSEEAQAADFAAKNPDDLRNITPDKPVRLFANRFAMKMQDGGLANMINNALANLQNSGFIDKVLLKHAAPDAYRRVTRAYQ